MTNLELAGKLQDAVSSHYCDLCGMLLDAGAALRNLHTENTALRVTEDNLRQELQECQDQRRAAFRRIEELDKELDAMRAQIGQGEPDGWQLVPKEPTDEMFFDPDDACKNFGESAWQAFCRMYYALLASAPPAAQQKPLTDEHVTDGSKCWCAPELNYKDPDTGAEVLVHRSKQ